MLKDPFTGQPSIPFTLYAMECEGEVNTPQGKRNKLIKNLIERNRYEVIHEGIVQEEFVNIIGYIPTEAEIEDILIEVMRQ